MGDGCRCGVLYSCCIRHRLMLLLAPLACVLGGLALNAALLRHLAVIKSAISLKRTVSCLPPPPAPAPAAAVPPLTLSHRRARPCALAHRL